VASRGEQRRKAREQGGADMKKFYWVFGAVAVVGVVAVGYSLGSSALGTAATEPVNVEGLDDLERLVALAQGVTKGDPNAPVTIAEFADYQCPGCGAFALSVKPQLELSYVQSGKAKLVFYDFPLLSIHPHAFLAARAARCAGDQDRFWEYHDNLFRNQPTWAGRSEVVGDFIDYAEATGLDTDSFEACLKSDRHADVVTANLELGNQLGISGTPTIMVSRGQGMARRLGNFDFQTIQLAVDAMLESSEPTGN
jgi:protein-disulfide isomerase